MGKQIQHDIVIIGSGSAGLSAALRLADQFQVALICKESLQEGSTFYAQGGIASVMNEQDDSLEHHYQDTIQAGAGLCDEATVKFTVSRARENIMWLVEQGMDFTKAQDSGEFHLTREGGHSRRRVLHHDDSTGKHLSNTLVDKAIQHPNIQIFAHQTAIDLIVRDDTGEPKCVGVYTYNHVDADIQTFAARHVILATGGASKVYLYTTNPNVSSGDGIAMAHRVGAAVNHMEFNQFHPTCLYHPQARSFLLTEAIRGEGGVLLLPDGQRFMDKHHPQAELAPRDIVARSIDYEMKRLGAEHLYLDISFKPKSFITQHFPMIYEKCLTLGLDMSEEPIPIVPAAHYTCGGVVTDLHGCTTIPGLYAIGETACTGLHGANRMASNSLLECLVFAESASKYIKEHDDTAGGVPMLQDWDESRVTQAEECVTVAHNWDELRRCMWDYVGIVRTNARLQKAKVRVQRLEREVNDYYRQYKVSQDLLELRNLVTVASLIIDAAIARKENLGLHYNLDYADV